MSENEQETFHAKVWGSGQITVPELVRNRIGCGTSGTVTVTVESYKGD